nr:SMI1/KNR4 family protein [Providencia sp. G1(2023)]
MPPEQFHELIWETLQQINKKDFHVVAAHSPTEEAIRDLENVTGITLPEDFCAFHNVLMGYVS